ncbi:uncharacterized protein HMPREF1541_04828 [Cyphellophora europaea CBS 101466]|uniref:Uncharacterized protein n=1 Tax=Cyphellophora europaea (strain CBS 101466) TaxID=1220924 RepID=W2RVL4_CYPE1|nr:uncharacterized protein HMPREF1541_04828 [Cyphellophora europaea CBS 101466]ETN40551.1 hypothetical protein HMPREF1541_04828 [Cyphellophora europaea CBS 101466]
MFGSSALPLPSNFAAQDHHRPLRLTSDSRASPAGDALLERIKRLEETIHHEREIRETALQRERSLWEREVRILREALAPFYTSEQDMRRKLIEVEDRVEGNYDEQIRLKDRVVAVDDANMTLEKRVDEIEQSRSKRRRVSRQPVQEDVPMYPNSSDERRISDERSVNSNSSYALSPSSNLMPLAPEREEARSSGILNLVEMTARSRLHPTPPVRAVQHRPEEARSSGFLALDLAERLGKNHGTGVAPAAPSTGPPPPPYMSFKDRYSPPGYAQSDPDATTTRRSPSFAPPGQSPGDLSPRKRKHLTEHMALDVLADVSMASPLIHG